MLRRLALLLLSVCFIAPARAAAPTEIILDTDIGDDLDDAFALALVLASPELRPLAITTSLGDTQLRARLVERLLHRLGRADIPVAAGPPTPPGTLFRQAAWARAEPAPGTPFPDAVALTLELLRRAPPRRITLVALAPLTSVGAMIARDPVAFRRLGRVVVMAGSIRRGYGRQAGTTVAGSSIEYNVRCDPDGLRRLLGSGVPVTLMPLDATEVALPDTDRARLFASHTVLADWLASLYPLWAWHNPWGPVPTLFDVVPVAWLLRPDICRPQPLRIDVSAAGATREVQGTPNLSACLDVDRGAVLGLMMQRLQTGGLRPDPTRTPGP